MFRPTSCCRTLLIVVLFAVLPAGGWSDEPASSEPVKSTDASLVVGQVVTVCGPVAGTGYFPHLKGEPTFINFDRLYPEQSFTVVIWGSYRDRFEAAPDRLYDKKQLCVTGRVETYKGKPQMVVQSPDQIRIRDAGLVAERFTYEERVLLKAMLAGLGYTVDQGTGEWDAAADRAIREFQAEQGLEDEGGRNPQTLRALAGAVDRVPPEAREKILRLLLLNLAQREEDARK